MKNSKATPKAEKKYSFTKTQIGTVLGALAHSNERGWVLRNPRDAALWLSGALACQGGPEWELKELYPLIGTYDEAEEAERTARQKDADRMAAAEREWKAGAR